MNVVRLPLDIDVERTALHAEFFERYPGMSMGDVLDAVAEDGLEAGTLASDPNCLEGGYDGWAYWLLYLKGYLQAVEGGSLGRGNCYLDYFVEQFLTGAHDPGLRVVVPDEAAAVSRVAARYEILRRALGGEPPTAEPVRVLASARQRDDLHVIHDARTGVAVRARAVDGWHRLFAARLGGHATVPGQVRVDEATWTWPA